jgi:hypothetical protein
MTLRSVLRIPLLVLCASVRSNAADTLVTVNGRQP